MDTEAHHIPPPLQPPPWLFQALAGLEPVGDGAPPEGANGGEGGGDDGLNNGPDPAEVRVVAVTRDFAKTT